MRRLRPLPLDPLPLHRLFDFRRHLGLFTQLFFEDGQQAQGLLRAHPLSGVLEQHALDEVPEFWRVLDRDRLWLPRGDALPQMDQVLALERRLQRAHVV